MLNPVRILLDHGVDSDCQPAIMRPNYISYDLPTADISWDSASVHFPLKFYEDFDISPEVIVLRVLVSMALVLASSISSSDCNHPH